MRSCERIMLALAQWLSGTPMSLAIHELDWLVPLLQTVHIIAIAMVVSSVFMIELRLLRVVKSQSIADTAHRFVPWIWTGLAILAVTGITLIIAEPQRALPNPAFQLKMLLLALAIAFICVFQISLGGKSKFWFHADQSRPAVKLLVAVLAISVFMLWCAIAFAGRLIAYLQPG